MAPGVSGEGLVRAIRQYSEAGLCGLKAQDYHHRVSRSSGLSAAFTAHSNGRGGGADSISITAFPVDSLSWLLHGRPGWIHTCIYIRRLLCALGSMSMLTVSAR